MQVQPREIVELIVPFMQAKQAEDILIADLRGLTDTTDYFVICTGTSEAQIKAIADGILEGMEALDHKPWHVEGYTGLRWVLIDFIDVVVHIFREETRAFYALERLWGDAKMEYIP